MRKFLTIFAGLLFAVSMMAETFRLVTDVTTLVAGDEIIIANADADYAIGSTQNNNNRAAASVSVAGDAIVPDETVQVITLEAAEADFMFSVGEDAYLYAASNSANHLKTSNASTVGDNGKFAITIDEDGIATIIAQGTNARNNLRYNPNNGNPLFSCYAETSSVAAGLKIFKKAESGGVTPVANSWSEIVFVTESSQGELDGTWFSNGTDFFVLVADPNGKMSVDMNTARFGDPLDSTSYHYRLKTGGKTAYQDSETQKIPTANYLTVNIPARGLLRIATRTGTSSATDRTIKIMQNGGQLYHWEVLETDTIMAGDMKYYKYLYVQVDTGTVEISYPVAGIYFYSFAFRANNDAPECYITDSWYGEANAANQMMINPANPAEYMIDMALEPSSRFKVVATYNPVKKYTGMVEPYEAAWYPQDNYASMVESHYYYGDRGEITEAGDYTVYFRPDGQGGTGWRDGYIYAEKKSAPVVEPTFRYYVVGSMNEWQTADSAYLLKANPSADGEYLGLFTFDANTEIKVYGEDGETYRWYPDNADNYVIAEEGEYMIYFRPDGQGGADWHAGYIYAEKQPEKVLPSTCAGAREMIMALDDNAYLYNQMEILLYGYVTEIVNPYDTTYGNISFWMADTQDGGQVLQAYRAVCPAEEAPVVGDLVKVEGRLHKYVNKSGVATPEFAQGCSVTVITEVQTPDELLAQLIEDAMLVKEFIAQLDTAIAAEMDPFIQQAQDILLSGDEALIQEAYDSALPLLDQVIDSAMVMGKEALVAELYALALDSDDEACQLIIANAVESVQYLAWDKNKDVRVNLQNVMLAIESIYYGTVEALEAARNGEAPVAEYYVVGTMTGWAVDSAYLLKADPSVEGEFIGLFTFAAGEEIKVVGIDSTVMTWYPDNADNFVLNKEGDYVLHFRPAADGGEDWYEGCIYAEYQAPVIFPQSCAEAREMIMALEDNTYLFDEQTEIVLQGYVTEIVQAYSTKYGNISFWMADTRNGGQVLEAYRANCPSDAVPVVGDLVAVAGRLQKYVNSSGVATPEFAKGCSVTVLSEELPYVEYYVVGTMTNWAADSAYMLKANPSVYGEYEGVFTFAAGDELKVIGVDTAGTAWYPANAGNLVIGEAGDYVLYFRPAADGGEDWYEGCIYTEYHAPVVLPQSCAEAREMVLALEDNAYLYDQTVFLLHGYVTEIVYDYDTIYGNITFWMADAPDGGQVLQAYRAVCPKEEAPVVGDLVAVEGRLHKYVNNSGVATPEFAVNSTVTVLTEEQTPADMLAQLIEDAMLIRDFVARFDTLAATQMDPYIQQAQEALWSGEEAVIQEALAVAQQALDEAIVNAMALGKEAIVAQLYGLALPSDDVECQMIIANAVGYIQSLEWDENKTVSVNLMDLMAIVQDIYYNTIEALEAARGGEEPAAEYYVVGTMTGWAADSAYMLKPNTPVEGEYAGVFTFAAGDELKVIGVDGESTIWYPDNADNLVIGEAGDYVLYFRPAADGGEGWYEGCIYMEYYAPVIVPQSCAEARELLLALEDNTYLNDQMEILLHGYVTEIVTDYSEQYGNISFWMADTQDGGQVLQAYRATCSAEAIPVVGDLVEVVGKMQKYVNKSGVVIPEFAAGCSAVVINEELTPADLLAQLIEDATLIREFIARFDTLAATQMDPYIQEAYEALWSGDEETIQNELAIAQAALDGAIDNAMAVGKEAIVAELNGLALPSDDEACQLIIANAVAYVQALDWDENKNVRLNLQDLMTAVEDIYYRTIAALEAARGGEEPVAEYYLVGTMTGWSADSAYVLKADMSVEGEYVGLFYFAAGDELKVIGVDGESTIWYPDNADNYVIGEDGEYVVYFRPDGNGGEDWYYGYIYAAKNDTTVEDQLTCLDIYQMAKNDVVEQLNDVVVTFANGRNVWVRDASASMLIYLPANGSFAAGDILSGVAGVVDIYNGIHEIKPSAEQVEAISVVTGEAPAAIPVAAVDLADVSKYIVMKGVEAEGEFVEGSQSNITINGVVVRNQFKNGYVFEAGKSYDIYGVVTIYQNNPQVYFITAEEASEVEPFGDYYVVGAMTGWSADSAYMLMPNPAAEGEYFGLFTFAAGDELKVIAFNGASTIWYPDNAGNLVIGEAGDYVLYFRPDGQGGEGWYYGYIYVEAQGSVEPTPAELLAQLIDDALLIRDFIAQYDSAAAVQMDPYIQQAQMALMSGNEMAIQMALNTAQQALDDAISDALAMGKDALVAQLNGLALATDDEICQQIIADAVAYVMALDWDEAKTVSVNLQDLMAAAEYIYYNTIQALEEARIETAIDNANAEFKAVKVIRDGKVFIEKNGVIYNVQGALVR